MRTAGDDSDRVADRVGPIVSSRWRTAFPRVPLARVRSGWFAFVPATDEPEPAADILQQVASLRFSSLGTAIGVSLDETGARSAADLLSQAWLAARLADSAGPVVSFQNLGIPLVRRLLPARDARELTDNAYPTLLADPNAAELVRTVLAYLDCGGSITLAAARLGVHRNTLQTRLRRAATLGIPLTDPAHTLTVHLLLAALSPSLPSENDHEPASETETPA